MDYKIIKSKKAQMTIWIIVALAIVGILLAMLLLNPREIIKPRDNVSFQASIEKCARDSVNEAIEALMPQGGFIEPNNYKVYKNTKVAYLCQNTGYFSPCINQHPMLIDEITKEIENYAYDQIENCFINSKAELEKRNYKISLSSMNLNISLMPGKIGILISREMTLEKNAQTESVNNFKIEVISQLYDLSKVAIEITNQEAKYCYFEYVGYMVLFPEISIEKFAFSDSTKIYTIQDKKSLSEMNIAVRGCAIPPGI